jgi:hypothetical protein
MAYIDYMGIAPEDIDLLNSEEFKSVLEKHPTLRLVTTDEDAEGEEVFNEVSLPLPDDHDGYVGIEDRDDEDSFMWILYDDCESVADPNPGFIAVLRAMDDFSVKKYSQRLFMSKDETLCMDDEATLEAEFDFSKGDYIL